MHLTGRELQLLEEISSLCGKTLEDNSQPILSVSDLQRLDKDVGEALILCGRSKPCITRLADIDIYDNNQFERIPVSSRTPQSPPKLEIKLPETEDRIPSNIVLSPSMLSQLFKRENTLNIDEMIKDIDKRIAELEEEEKQMKSKVHAENKDIKEDK